MKSNNIKFRYFIVPNILLSWAGEYLDKHYKRNFTRIKQLYRDTARNARMCLECLDDFKIYIFFSSRNKGFNFSVINLCFLYTYIFTLYSSVHFTVWHNVYLSLNHNNVNNLYNDVGYLNYWNVTFRCWFRWLRRRRVSDMCYVPRVCCSHCGRMV